MGYSSSQFGFSGGKGGGGGVTVKDTELFIYTADGTEGKVLNLATIIAGFPSPAYVISIVRSNIPLNKNVSGTILSNFYRYNTVSTDLTFGNNLQPNEQIQIQYRAA